MHREIYRYFCFLALSVLLWSCSKDKIDFISVDEKQVSAGLMLQVLDEAGEPLPEATVYLKGISYHTDQLGLINIDAATLSTANNSLLIRKSGYFESQLDFNVQSGSLVSLHSTLYKISEIYTIDGNEGGSVRSPGGLHITFPPQAFNLAGSAGAYTGEIKVALRYIDPASADFFSMLPVRLTGLDPEGNARLLRSYGVVQVALTDDQGRLIELQPGKTAHMIAPAPSLPGILNAAIWHYDKNTGFWKEENTITHSQDYVSTDLQHFGYLSLAGSEPAVLITARLKDAQGRPFSYVRTVIKNEETGTSAFFTTDSDGSFGGFVPKNAALKMSVLAICDKEFYAASLPNITRKTDLGDLLIPPGKTDVSVLAVKASLHDCQGQPLARGLAKLAGNPILYPADGNGKLELLIPMCEAIGTARFTFLDPKEDKITGELAVTYPAGTALGQVIVCEDLQDFVQLSCPGLQLDHVSLMQELDLYTDTANGNKNLFAYTDFNGLRLNLIMKWNDPGAIYHAGDFSLLEGKIYGVNVENIDGTIVDGIINITGSRQAGEPVEGTFEGKIELKNNPGLLPFSGRFRIRGQ